MKLSFLVFFSVLLMSPFAASAQDSTKTLSSDEIYKNLIGNWVLTKVVNTKSKKEITDDNNDLLIVKKGVKLYTVKYTCKIAKGNLSVGETSILNMNEALESMTKFSRCNLLLLTEKEMIFTGTYGGDEYKVYFSKME